MAKQNTVPDINEKRAAIGRPPLAMMQMMDFIHEEWPTGAWPQSWAQQLINSDRGNRAGRG
jgi:hypothetical protein